MSESENPQFENRLERLLVEAAANPSARPEFYRELLGSQIVIVPHGPIRENDNPAETATLRMATIEHNGIQHIPFFLALKFLPREATRQAALPARQFFEITRGSHLVLNPGAQFGKIFTPDEVERLLSGKMLDVEKEFKVSGSAKVLVGKPKNIPPHLLEQLAKFFATEPAVRRAWLGWYHNPAVEKEPGYLLAVDAPGVKNFRELAGRISLILREVGTAGCYCDIVQYEGNGITGYFRSQEPFYSKPLWQRLRSWF